MTPTTPTTIVGDPIVAQAISRALATVRANQHEVAGLLAMAPRPLAMGVCVRCGGRLTVGYTSGLSGGPQADYGTLQGPCGSSGAWKGQADATESLRALALCAQDDPRFLAYPLHLYARRHDLNGAQLAQRLELPASALNRLYLSAVPSRADGPTVQRLAREAGASSQRLAQVLAEAQALVDEDGRERQRQERAAKIEEARRERDSYLGLYQRAQERLDALMAAAVDDAPATLGGR